MARILGIDYGTIRIGLAVTDPLQLIANGLTTVSNAEVISFLKEYTEKESVEAIAIGLPKRLNNTSSELTVEVEKFIKKLRKTFPKIAVHAIDERFTSKMATAAILQSGIKKEKRKDKALVDEVSATIILQSYLEQKENRI